MLDVDALKAKILSHKPDLTLEELNRLIEEKKREVGAGYLNDAGACWLIASELGVPLDKAAPTTPDLTPSTLQVGLSEATVRGRILSIYPAKTYIKRDGTEGRYRKMVIFDERESVQVTLWDNISMLPDTLRLRVGQPIKVVNGYVRVGLDGKPMLYVGYRGTVEPIEEEPSSLERLARDVSEVRGGEPILAVKGILDSEPKYSEFTRRDGSRGSVLHFYLKGREGGRVRVALWESSPQMLQSLQYGCEVLLLAVRPKALANGGLEIHGDEATTLISHEPKAYQPDRRVLRLVSKGVSQADDAASILLLDEEGHPRTYIEKAKP